MVYEVRVPSLYQILTREPRPRSGEPKAVWLLRRELQRATLRLVKSKVPALWETIDRAEHRRNLSSVNLLDRDAVLAQCVKTETGRTSLSHRMVARECDPIYLPDTIWRHFARHNCASGTGSMIRCDVRPDDPSRKTRSGYTPPTEHPGELCSGACPYCKKRYSWGTDVPV